MKVPYREPHAAQHDAQSPEPLILPCEKSRKRSSKRQQLYTAPGIYDGTEGFLDGLSGQELDYAMVHMEQTHVQKYLNSMDPAERAQLIASSNEALKKYGTDATRKAIEQIEANGETFDFGNQEHREALGRATVDFVTSKVQDCRGTRVGNVGTSSIC